MVDDLAVLGGGPARRGPVLGPGARVRSHTVIYAGVRAGRHLHTGHAALIRERTVIGDDVLIGSGTIVEGNVRIGSRVSIQSRVFIPTHTRIGSNVFIGPGAILTNDPYPVRRRVALRGPVIEDGASIGAGAVVLPGVRIGRGAFVAAGAIVTHDVPARSLAIGAPARTSPLPEALRAANRVRRRA